ncbi:MAG: thiolase family protein [Ferroplasma sp.]
MIRGFSEAIYKNYEGSAYEIRNEAFNKALYMAGLERKDIDGFMTTFLPGVFDGNIYMHFFPDQICNYLGIKPRYIDSLEYGGPSVLSAFWRAENIVKAGMAENILLLFGGKGSEVRKKKQTVDSMENIYPEVVNTPYKPLLSGYNNMNPVSDYALLAQRHKKVYGSTDEQRAMLIVKQRENANRSGYSMFSGSIKVEDVLISPIVSSPLHLLEIVYPVDGFHAFIVSKNSGKLREIRILKYGEAHQSALPPEMMDITVTPAAESSSAFRNDIKKCDFYELYDSFSITVMIQLENTGLVPPGTSGSFLEKNSISVDGDFPLNTGGGSLNRGQPAYMSGSVILYETLLQMNEMAGKNQVKNPGKAFINGMGGWSRNHSVSMILGD